jgi:competence protein CoiA
MLCARRVADGASVEASIAERTDGPFQCPVCEDPAILRKGLVQIHHFAHKGGTACAYGRGESDEHRHCKREIFESLRTFSNVTEVRLENPLGEVRPDVSAVIGGVRVAIEVQLSSLQPETIVYRTEAYARLGIPVLWVSQWNPKLEEDRFNPRVWELWVHSAYFGRVYYWRHSSTVVPVRFERVERHVGDKEWRNEYGEVQSIPGFSGNYKRCRRPIVGRELEIARDFHRTLRKEFTGGKLPVPRCLLYSELYDKRRT